MKITVYSGEKHVELDAHVYELVKSVAQRAAVKLGVPFNKQYPNVTLRQAGSNRFLPGKLTMRDSEEEVFELHVVS